MTDREWVGRVQRRALERALVDDVDARRYFALAGSLDVVRQDGAATADAETGANGTPEEDIDGVLPAALLSLAVVPYLDEIAGDSPVVPPTPSGRDPWSPATDATRPAIRRGARLALRWFDVPPERVAARARLPESALTAPSE